MKCYFTYCEETGERVLIPQCWGTVHSNDIKDCCCATETANFARFEKKQYNDTIKEKNAEIEALQKYYDFGEMVILNQRLKLSLIIEQCAANVLESDYVYEFERDFWFKDLNRYERRKLINKVFGAGFFDNLSLSLKLRILKY